ncbi:Uncharacterised protein [Streptococcus pneumoniae]|uniref:Uncharacterized protein n=1 Tax=Bacillus cereus (strain Q1) TaxID=361100 RepID=B9J171_BACCQ|nr:conserved hypothetical protein [Bacillus cereus Q1]MBY5228664.1 hypothetical protein [Bacillus paranthracis]CJQ10705.1 Uncharacterised protein [Streptococcus pneumoniae]
MGDILKDNKSNKILKIGTNIILVLLLIGAIQMFYDDDYTNDHFDWLFFAIFWVIKSISSSKISLKDRDKKSVLLDVGLVVISCVLLAAFSVKYFF